MTSGSSQQWAPAAVGLFAVSIFSSAFLIFAVQPMVGKHILPWFGGTPGVWLICLAFYQSTLFFGYAYAYWLTTNIPVTRQPLIHGAVLAFAMMALPVLPGEAWKPDGGEAASAQIFFMLLANVAVPFMWLASTGPLVQTWFARAFPTQSPYPLYAVSNLGSLLALVSYPFLVEPRLALSMQSSLWTWGFAACGLAVVGCAAWAGFRARHIATANREASEAGPPEPLGSFDVKPVIGARRRFFWLLFPASAVTLFMGVTNHLCLDVASVPFLWILPLSTYLITLILCFGSEKFYPRTLVMAMAAAALAIHFGIYGGSHEPGSWSSVSQSIVVQVGFYSAMLFLGCMVAHGELYRLRPAPDALAEFYLYVAAGGALGGLFVGIAAPRFFNGYYELPIGVTACWVLALAAMRANPSGVFDGAHRGAAWALSATLSVAILAVHLIDFASGPEKEAHYTESETIDLKRGFFGIVRVLEGGLASGERWTVLRNGTTRHGMQFHSPRSRRIPTTYFGSTTGVGLVLASDRESHTPTKVGVIGLGIGTLAAYGRKGDDYVFYEIDPEVVRVAEDPRFFTYLSDSDAAVEIVLGDARLSLESELQTSGSREFNVLVLDAFSSDAIPTHLLTEEAFALYDKHVQRDGLMAIHITNRHLNLGPLVMRLGAGIGMDGAQFRSKAVPELRSGQADWVILARDPRHLERVKRIARNLRSKSDGSRLIRVSYIDPEKSWDHPVWTDDCSNIFSVLMSISSRTGAE